jgi:feruloyl esterase
MSAQRFPTDCDGIVAGMPANNWTRLMAGDFGATLAVFTDAANRLTPPALGVLFRGALAACDASDGVTDGVVGDPQRCRFDPSTLVCTTNQAPGSCLSPGQAEAARRVYQDLKDPKTGAQLYPGLAPGSEPFWPNRDPANPFPIPIASSIARGPCVRNRNLLPIKVRETRTTRQTSSVRHPEET